MGLDKKILGNKRKDYLTWDEFFIGVTKLAAGRCKDPSTQVGACIVSDDNRILAIGYNGAPNNFNDDEFPWEREGDHYNTKYPYVVHAEMNAILNYPGSKRDLVGSRVYVDLFPCSECSKVLIQTGIKEVIYLSDKYDKTPDNTASKLLLDTCHIKYRKVDESVCKKVLRVSLKPDEKIEYIEK